MPSNTCMACMACEDADCQLLQLPCGEHAYCVECWHTAVHHAVTQESCYPIKCGPKACKTLPDQFVIANLATQDPATQTLCNAFQDKIKEYHISPQDRTYCANTACVLAQGHSQFIDATIFGSEGRVTCPSCSGMTCCKCKISITNEASHVCGDVDHDQAVTEYIASQPESERWLWKKCPCCGIWTNKVTACNHMGCTYCSAEFCLVCGREWEGPASCRFGCPKFQAPVYDWEGFNQLGFNPKTGLDREGNAWSGNDIHLNDGYDAINEDFDDFGDDWEEEEERIFGEDGFDQWGRDGSGYDREGFDTDGFNRQLIDRQGFDWWGFNAAGYDRNGFDRFDRDVNGFDKDGFDVDGYDVNGMSLRNFHRNYYDEEGYDPFGLDVFGFSRAGFNVDGYDKYGFSDEGFNQEGRDRLGYDARGIDAEGYDRFGRDSHGYSREGYNAHHRTSNGQIEPGYYEAPDGSLRRIASEGPSETVMECNHATHHRWTGATCLVCEWRSDEFIRHCGVCDTYLCKQCDRAGVDIQRNVLRERFLWPGADSYGIAEMFGRASKENSEEKTIEGKTSGEKTSEEKTSEEKTSEEKTSEEKTSEE
ncbi:hypothetical protein PRZ48_000893 [Zasmidium cellare]|uniref:RBR-type E3 ubiquitin transferase n=1 Tax=Zasmidium cellare TaxID=395010 RepID=A0ABR0EZQ4_ZASCE|nr:hypothetical protein PRZ48_000893 [Zasmidium cellare]